MMDFIIYALLAGLGISLMTGPLGCFIVWRKMAYFGDTLAHSALLGVSIALWFSVQPFIGVALCCLVLAISLATLQETPYLATDTLLGILSHSSLALGLVISSLMTDVRIDLMAYLFGHILTVGQSDLLWLAGIAGLALPLLYWNWNGLLAITCSVELAAIEGYPVKRLKLLLVGLIAAVVAIGIKVIGMLLITALLIIPAATARQFARSPESMAFIATLLSCLAVLSGIALSYSTDAPAGPAIVLSTGIMFSASLALRSALRLLTR